MKRWEYGQLISCNDTNTSGTTSYPWTHGDGWDTVEHRFVDKQCQLTDTSGVLLIEKLAYLGEVGWELVSTEVVYRRSPGDHGELPGEWLKRYFFFKRQIETTQIDE